MEDFIYEKDADGIVTVTMDMQGQGANTMNARFEPGMRDLCDKLEAEEGLTGVVFASAKSTFFAGGDLKDILATMEAGQREFELIENSKATYRRLEKLPVPVVAAINGAALGGGYELCLSCNHRVVVDDPKAIVGLPEVTLGLLPGGGGTQMLRRFVPLDRALDMLTSGKPVAVEDAAGLVARVVPADGLVDAAVELAEEHRPDLVIVDVKMPVLDGIAAAERMPVRIGEQIPNVMIPQWHRGSDWAVGHAERFRDAVGERITAGRAVVEDERVRMMWIGAGLWFDTKFYTAFEEEFGAVFAWSMYLPFAANGYVRRSKGDYLRALAARVVTMNEQLHQAPWANAWLVKQARDYRIDLAVVLVPEADRPSGYATNFITEDLREAGVEVVEIHADMVDARKWNGARAKADVIDGIRRVRGAT